MTRYTYKVIPAPAKGRKAQGVKGAEARFAYGLEEAINEMAAQGWEYLRADILPSEERQGLTSTATVYRSVLVFRREAKGTGQSERPVPSLTARRGPVPEEELTFTRKRTADEDAAEAEIPQDNPESGDLPETTADDRAANDDAPVQPGEETAETDAPETAPERDETDDTVTEEEKDTPRR